jgi:hypothetical protein
MMTTVMKRAVQLVLAEELEAQVLEEIPSQLWPTIPVSP